VPDFMVAKKTDVSSAARPIVFNAESTAPPKKGLATITSTGTGGNWSATGTWVGGVLPGSGDDVVISDGATVTIDTSPTVLSLTVGQGTAGILQFEQTTVRVLTVTGSVTIATGGTFRSNNAGTVTTHALSVGANFTNNGTLDFSTNGNTAG